jgi:hypothetical protein
METLLALLIIALLYGGGFVLAFGALLFAAFRKSRGARIALSVVALIALVAQGRCWHIASGIGKSTGGGGGSIIPIMIFAGAVALVWSTILVASAQKRTEK